MPGHRIPPLPRFAVHGDNWRITLDQQHNGKMAVTVVNDAAGHSVATIIMSPAAQNALTTFLMANRPNLDLAQY